MSEAGPLLACLSAYDEALVRELAGTDAIRIRIASGSGSVEELHDLVAEADLVIADAARRYVLDAPAIAAMSRCRFIQQPAVGYDSIDVDQAARQGIPVANTPGSNAAAVADWVVMATLNVLRDGVAADRSLHERRAYAAGLGAELGALTVGLVGAGAVARQVAERLRGFGSEVLHTSRRPTELPGSHAVGFGELLERADVVSLHLPLTAQTRNLLGPAEFARMRPGSILVNSARGGLVDADALVAALSTGRPAAAALDVFEPEPLPLDSPLRGLGNVYLSPHIAANSHQARARVRRAVGENLRRVLAGEAPVNVVNSVR
ncbi:MAG TPA: NAD(P)-dependent oxidoreductase [Jatrophihabitans sp.]|nr:NAD(P)-dependent oxidoreductase [Jatrophihabitans sp.]